MNKTMLNAQMLIALEPKDMHVRKLHSLMYDVQVQAMMTLGVPAYPSRILTAAARPLVQKLAQTLAYPRNPRDVLMRHLNRHGQLHEKQNEP